MTDAEIRKLRELSKKYTILCKVFSGVYPIQGIGEDDSVWVADINIPLVNAVPDNFFVSIPLSQIKKGFQPQ